MVHTVDEETVTTLIAALPRRGDAGIPAAQLATRPGPDLPSTDHHHRWPSCERLLRSGRVWLGYSDADGRGERMLFSPDRVEGGQVQHGCEGPADLSIHRVTGAAGQLSPWLTCAGRRPGEGLHHPDGDGRPRWPAIQVLVSTSASRSTPVCTPAPLECPDEVLGARFPVALLA